MGKLDTRRLFTDPDAIDRDEYFIAHYRIKPRDGLNLREAATRIATLSSLRTALPPSVQRSVLALEAAYVIKAQEETGLVSIAYPFKASGVTCIGDLFALLIAPAEYNYADELVLDLIELPRGFIQEYLGPSFGIEGIRHKFQVADRPIIGVVPNPRIGRSLNDMANACKEALIGGADFIADDLLVIDRFDEYSPEHRTEAFVRAAHEAASTTGLRKWFAASIPAHPARARVRASKALEYGSEMIIVNGFTMGFDFLSVLAADASMNAPIISTNMGIGVMTLGADRSRGVSEALVAKFSRLAGADGMHLGASSSVCYADNTWKPASSAVHARWAHLKSSFPVAEGDLTVASIWENVSALGPDLILETSSGILDYPGGPGHGGEAFRTFVERITSDLSNEDAHTAMETLYRKSSIIRAGFDHYGYNPKTRDKK